MPKFFKQHFVHFVLYVFEAAFKYLHKYFDIYYNLDSEEFEIACKKGVNKDA